MRNGQLSGGENNQTQIRSTSKKRVARLQMAAAFAVGSLCVAGTAQYAVADTYWIFGTSGNTATTATSGGGSDLWSTATNWNNGLPDTGTQNAFINNNGVVNIAASQHPNDVDTGTVGGGAGGTFQMTAGTLTVSGWMRMGESAGSSGTFNLSGGTINESQVDIGESGNGTFEMSAGTVNASGTFSTGTNASGIGTILVTGGTLNITNANNNVQLANATNSTSFFNLTNGIVNVASQTFLSNATGAVSTMNVSGGVYNDSNWVAVGRGNGTGILNIMPGGTFQKLTGTGNITFAGLNNTLNQTGGLFVNTASQTWIGEGVTSVYNMSGGTANLGLVELGNNATSKGTINLTGGTLAATTFTKGSGTGTINLSGGTLASNASNSPWIGAAIVLNVQSGGAIFNTQGFTDGITQALLHSGTGTDGGVTLNDPSAVPGILKFNNSGSTYNGNTTITSGIMESVQTGSIPGLNNTTGQIVTVGSAGALVAGVGGPASQFTSAQVDSLRATVSFASGASFGLDTNFGAFTYASNVADGLNGPLGFVALGNGSNILTLSGSNTFTGPVRLGPGSVVLLNSVDTGTSGPLGVGGMITFGNAGVLEYSSVNNTDYSPRFNTSAGQSFGINTNGSNISFASPLVSGTGNTGSFNKSGAGSLTLNGANNLFSQFFIKGGSVILPSGSNITTTNFSDIGQGNGDFGTLTLQGTANLTVAGDFNISDVASSSGILNLTGTGTVSNPGGTGIYVGKSGSSTGILNMSGGIINQNQGGDAFRLGGSGSTADANSVGFLVVTGGTINSVGSEETGYYGTGYFTLAGGSFTSATFPDVARQTGSWGLNDVNGGTFNQNNSGSLLLVGEAGAGYMVVRNGGILNSAGGITLAKTNVATGVLTIAAGGLVVTPYISPLASIPTGAGGAGGTSVLNFNGGTLRSSPGAANASTNFLSGLTAANIFPGGATIDTTNGNITIPQALVAPAGQGLSNIALNGSGGVGYATPPVVKITGGGGVGATAVANLDGTGAITGFTILNPGTGYTSAPTISLVTGIILPTTAAPVPISSISTNSAGGLTIIGGNTLISTAANTYTGQTNVSNGTLELGNGTTSGTITNTSGVTGTASGTLWYNLLTNRTVGYPVSGGVNLTVNDTGTTKGNLTLTGSNTYTGATSIVNSNLTLDHSGANTGSLGNTAVSFPSGFTLFVRGNTGIGNNAGGTLTMGSSSTLEMRDGTLNTLTIGGQLSLNGDVINVDLGSVSGASDQIVAGSISSNGTTTININPLGALASGASSYILLNSSSASLTPGGSGFTLGTTGTGFTNYSLANSTSNEIILSITANPTPGLAYWTGLASNTGSDPNNWGFGAALPTAQSNWSTNPGGTADPLQVPGASTDVVFTASNAVSRSGAVSTQLDASYSIKGLSFDTHTASGVSSVSINTNANTLAIGVDGLTVASADNSSSTISGTGGVVLNASQTWANNSAQPLTVSAPITGTANSGTLNLGFNGTGSGNITLSGAIADGVLGGNLGLSLTAGQLTLAGSNTYTGGVNLSGGQLHLASAGALNSTVPQTLNFLPGTTGDVQVNGTNEFSGSLVTDPTTPGSAVIENASAAAGSLTINVSSGTSTYAGLIQDGIGGGSLGINKTGPGAQVLTSSNTFTGPINVSQGSLVAGNNTALGSALGAVQVLGGDVVLNNGITVTGKSITINGTGSALDGALAAAANATATWAGPIVLGSAGLNASTARIGTLAGGTLIVSGVISNGTASGVDISGLNGGGGTVQFTGANTYNGSTSVIRGNLIVTGTGSINAIGNISVDSSATPGETGSLTVQPGANVTTTGLMFVGFSTGAATLTVQGNNTTGGTLNFNYVRFGNTGVGGATTNSNYIQTGGTTNASTYFVLGYSGPGNATANMSGGVLNVNTNTTAQAGNLEISTYDTENSNFLMSGGTVNLLHNSVIAMGAQNNTNVGTFNQTGGTVSFYSDGGLTLGGTGALQIGAGTTTGTYSYYLAGGTLNANLISKPSTTGTGRFYFNGGNLNALGSNTAFMSGVTGYVQAGGANVNIPSGFTDTITSALLHDNTTGAPATDGGLTLTGGGELILNDANAFTGVTNISAGTLAVTGGNNPSNRLGNTINVQPGATLLYLANNEINTSGVVSLNGNSSNVATFNFSGYLDYFGGLNLNGNALVTNGAATGTYGANGGFILETATPVVNANGSNNVVNTNIYVSSNFASAGGSKTLTINTPLTTDSLTVGGNIINGVPDGGAGTLTGGILKTGSGTLYLTGTNSYTGGTNVTGGTLSIADSGVFPGNTNLTIGPGALARVETSANTPYGFRINVFSNTGVLDVTGNVAVIHNVSSGTLGTIMGELASGYNNGNWNGTSGIISSTAAADPSHLTAVGVLINDVAANTLGYNSSAGRLYPSVDNTATSDGDIILKYTYYGDANLDGAVDGSDYSLIDNGYLATLTGWYNGDFNYDGTVNGSDYTLIDNAFNIQSVNLAAEIASPTAQIAGSAGTSAVPEPATLGLLGLGAVGLLGRRSRRRR